MENNIRLGPVTLDARDYASQGNAILGIRDSGKSYTATLLAEKLMAAGIPIIAFDPIGRWRFLRVAGKGPGFPIVIAGGEHGDLPLTPAGAPEIVKAAMREGVSLVIDLYSMNLSKADWKAIVERSVRTLLYENKAHGLRHLFIEEAAEFAPQRVGPDQGRVYAEIEKLARMGGNALLGYTLINQRAEEVNKAVLELCDGLFLHRQKGRNSLNALSKWLDIADAKGGKDVIASLPTLPQGQCWAWAAGSDKPVLIKVPAKQTFEPDRRAMRDSIEVERKAVDVSSFVSSMATTLSAMAAEAAENDPKLLKRRIAELERQTGQRGASEAELTAAHSEGLATGRAQGRQEGFVAGVAAMRRLAVESVHGAAPEAPADWAVALPPARKPVSTVPVSRPARPAPVSQPTGGAELRILRVLASRHPAKMTEAQWATLAGMKRTGGTWQTYKSRLRTAGYLDETSGQFLCSAAGLEAAGEVDTIDNGDVIDMWKRAMGGGAARVLEALVSRYPHAVGKDELAAEVEMAASGGTFQTYLSRLRSNGLIEGKGEIKASDHLFT